MNKPEQAQIKNKRLRAFTLLEVMVAVLLLALSFSALLTSHGNTMRIASQAHHMTIASQLAQAKLYDCEHLMLKDGFSTGDFKESGKFDDEGYPNFFWECYGYQPDMPVPQPGDISEKAMDMMPGADQGTANPMAEMGMGMIAPLVSQLSSIMHDSIRELVVVVKWQEGNSWDEMQVTTHIVDTKAVKGVAQQMQNFKIPGLGALDGAAGLGAGGGK